MSKIPQTSQKGCLDLCGIRRKSWVMNILQLDLQSEYCEEFIFLKNKAAFPVQALNCLFFLNDIFVIFFFFFAKESRNP